MNAEPHPAHVRLTLAAIAAAPTDDRMAFAAFVKRCGDPFTATLVAALRQAPEFLEEHFPEMPEDERAERLRLCRLWLDFEEAR
ncbi:hypothetical protein ACRQ1B_03265 [Rhizobium panacihumi]|uniref:hypothetical protein n=1 Tax=Rhizobium panacihumi TaxID=2008450 RepID=UPI003D791612